jgi:galactose oxidase-like protein/Kelch motif protein
VSLDLKRPEGTFMLTRRIGSLTVLTILAAAGSALLVAQAPQDVSTWSSAGVFQNPYGDGPSVALADGRTLIVGGATSDGTPTEVVAIFDPATNALTTAGALLSPRTGHTATLQKDGRILVTGGLNGSLVSGDVEVFDPVSGTSTLVATLPEPRTGHSAARLNDGRVLIVGGRTLDGVILRSALVIDPDTNAITPVMAQLATARASASATTLVDGRVVVIGGTDGTTDLRSAEVFTPLSDSFSTLSTQLTDPASGHSAVMLPHNGSVLVVGGTSNGPPRQGVDLLLPAEFPDPFSYGDGQFASTAPLSVPRSNVIAGPTPTEGYAFAAGGGTNDFEQYRFATIKTDKDDYAPGQHAVITGTGWQAGEQVRLVFQEDPAVHDDYELTLTADGQGNIYTDQWAPEQHDLNVRFYLTASDSKSKAQTTFTDGNLMSTINFSITPGSVTPGATLSWSVGATCRDGNGQNQSCASEGYTDGGPVQNGYLVDIQQATNAAFTQNLVTRVVNAGTTSGAVSGTFSAPPSGGPFFYRARHSNQNLSDVPVQGSDPNSWQPETSNSVTVTLVTDTTPPVITPNVTGTLGNNGWYKSNVTISWTVTDPQSAITSPACTTSTVTTDTAGQTFSCSATSAGGTSSNSVTIKRDASAPNPPTATKSPAANASGWNNTDVTVSYTDNGDNGPSGIAVCTFATTFTTETAGTSTSGACFDNAGNSSTSTPVTVKIDKTAPINVVGAPARPADHNGWFTSPVTINFSGVDALSGIASCTTVPFSGPDGSGVSVSGSCTDVAGNTSPNAVFLVNYDTTAPSISGSRTPAANGFGWNNADVSVSFTCTDATSGVAPGNPTGNSVVSSEGASQSRTGTCVDNAGLSASATVSNINIDKTAPTINATRTPAPNADGWNNTDVTANYTASDALSGLDSAATGSHVFNTDGSNQSHTFTVTDKAGNSASATISDVNIDRVGPEISGLRSPDANANGWNNTDVTVSFSCTDAASGLATGYPPAPTTVSTEGANQSVNGSCADKAGNTASASVTGINIDKTAPTISADRTPAANANGWNNTNVTANYTASDALSGLDSAPTGSHVFNTEGTGLNHTFTVTDKAGNSASATVSDVKIDKTAPTISGSRTPLANANGWNNTDVTANYNASDALSGLDATSPATGSHLFSAEGAGQSFTFTVTDQAGNSASFTISDVQIDKTAPSISAQRDTPANANGWNNSDVLSSYSASDGLSGLDSPATGGFTFTGEGASLSHTFTVVDKAGNSASATVSGVKIDRTAPSINADRTPAANGNGWNNSNVTATYNASDALAGLDGASPATGSHLFSAEAAGQSFTFTVTDLAGNSASATISNVNIDKTAPSISAQRDTAPNANGWNNTDVSSSYNASDALSGLESPATGTFTFTVEGNNLSHTFTVVDLAGNSASATVGGVKIDKTAPAISGSRTPAANGNGWNNSDVTATYNASDGLSGLDAASPATGSHLFSVELAGQSFTFTVTDQAGNSASFTISNVNIDKTAPSISAQRDTAPNTNGWNNGDVLSSYSASDLLSGLDSPATGGFTFTGEGASLSHTFTVFDLAGNSASATVSGVKIDRTAPSINVNRTPAANANGWNNSNVTATYNASDALAGLDAASPATGSHLFSAELAGQSFTFSVTDLAGNSASATISNVNIDKTAPSISAQRDTPANAYGWNNTDVLSSYTASDGLSGLDSPATGGFTFSSEGDYQSHVFTVVDKAGNSASATVSGVKIDKTTPVVAVTGVSNSAVYTLGTVPPAGCSTTDPLSGVLASAALSTSGAVPPGVGTITASCAGATDKAGNAASTTSVTFTVQFAAEAVMCNGAPGHQMLQPINFTGSSVFPKKGGSTVPAKFRVCGTDGVSIGPTPVVKNFVLYGVLNGTTVDVNEAPVESTNNDTAFRWSASDAQWIFNISTKDLTAGKTYVYRVYLHDGTYIQFQFGLK